MTAFSMTYSLSEHPPWVDPRCNGRGPNVGFRPSATNRRVVAAPDRAVAPRRLAKPRPTPHMGRAGLPGASGNNIPGADSNLPGAGTVVIVVTVSGSHLQTQALGG